MSNSFILSIISSEVSEFIQLAKEKHGYDQEQALAMLFWHQHDLDTALQDLGNFTPSPDQWSQEDKISFQEVIKVHGKSFPSIRQMLPHKSSRDLVKYYYRSVASITFWLRTTISDIAAGRRPR